MLCWSGVSQMLQELKWPSLQHRRTVSVARLTMLFKINSHELPIIIPEKFITEKFIPVANNPNRPVTRSQRPSQYINYSTRTEAYKNSFYPRTIRQWNRLPATIIKESTSAKSFNTKVWSYMQNDHSAQLYTGGIERRCGSTSSIN